MPDGNHLQELARQVRASTLHFLDDAESSWLTWTPPGTSNHILWHAGHILWAMDLLCVKAIAGNSELPECWAETFGQGSRPEVTTEWPRRDMLR